MAEVPAPLKPYLEFERAQWANGSVEDEAFYHTPAYGAEDQPGKVLKMEDVTDTSKYLLPPGMSMSRFIYLSEGVHGAPVPVSAYIFWPFTPRTHAGGKAPVVAWAHGTSGLGKDAAPSHLRHVWQHFLGPYQMVLHGYVVVATDYAGTGVTRDASGAPIVHPYLYSANHALDVLFSVQAAQSAFPILSSDFVTIGHSQGGGTAWAVAERQATKPVPGCLGCVAVSPPTRILDEGEPFVSILAAAVSDGVKSVYQDADLSAFLTSEAQERTALIRETRAGVMATIGMLFGVDLVKPGFKDDPYLRKYTDLAEVGGKALGCPLLVVHGTADPKISAQASRSAAERTAEKFPQASIAYLGLPGVTHDAAMTAGLAGWMAWIAARFAGTPAPPGLMDVTAEPVRPMDAYHKEVNWYLELATEPYQAP